MSNILQDRRCYFDHLISSIRVPKYVTIQFSKGKDDGNLSEIAKRSAITVALVRKLN